MVIDEYKKIHHNGSINTVEIGYSWPDGMTWIVNEWKNTQTKDIRYVFHVESKEAIEYIRDSLTKIIEDWDRIDKEYDEDMIRLEKEG